MFLSIYWPNGMDDIFRPEASSSCHYCFAHTGSPILLHSPWIFDPAFLLIAPATPPPRFRAAFAALTMASVPKSVMSPRINSKMVLLIIALILQPQT